MRFDFLDLRKNSVSILRQMAVRVYLANDFVRFLLYRLNILISYILLDKRFL